MNKLALIFMITGLSFGVLSTCQAEEELPEEQHVDTLLQDAIILREASSKDDVVMYNAGEEPFLVSRESRRVAYETNKDLNESILFYTKFLRKRLQVREFMLLPNHLGGRHVKTNTTDDETIHYTHFDRGSDTLLVIGGALLNQEKMASFVKMFNQYDVVIFNHRFIKYHDSSVFKPLTWPYWLSSTCVGEAFHGGKMSLGETEENDVYSVIYDIFKRKSYKKIYGLALCYSAPIFIKAATMRPGIFDKLVLDGCWIHVQAMIERYMEFWCGERKASWFYKILPTNREWFAKFFMWLAEKCSGVKFRTAEFDFTPYVQQLDIPVLFIHSTYDDMVPTSEFKELWGMVPAQEKAVMLTTCPHIRNYLKIKELYKYAVDAFFEKPYGEFVESLQL